MASVGRKVKNGWKKFKKVFSRKPKRTEVMCIETITSTDASQPTQDATVQNANNSIVGEGVLANDAALTVDNTQSTTETSSVVSSPLAQESIGNEFEDSWQTCISLFMLECEIILLCNAIREATIKTFDLKIESLECDNSKELEGQNLPVTIANDVLTDSVSDAHNASLSPEVPVAEAPITTSASGVAADSIPPLTFTTEGCTLATEISGPNIMPCYIQSESQLLLTQQLAGLNKQRQMK